ncbi:hypothetical protein ACSBR2_035749 [Camellia fascicularis]
MILISLIGDMEFKQNKFLPAEKQIVTANPDINTVSFVMMMILCCWHVMVSGKYLMLSYLCFIF